MDPRLIWTLALILVIGLILAVGLNERRRLATKRQALLKLLKDAGFIPATALLSDDGLSAAAVDWRDRRVIFASLAGAPYVRQTTVNEIKGAELLIDDRVSVRIGPEGRVDVRGDDGRPPSVMVLRLRLGPPERTPLELCLVSIGGINVNGNSSEGRRDEALRFLDRLAALTVGGGRQPA